MSRSRSMVVRASLACAIAGIGAAILLFWSGGVSVHLAGRRISATDPSRPLVVGVMAAILAVVLVGVRPTIASTRDALGRITPAPAAVALAIVIGAVSAGFNSWTASGPDSFAYVSQAALWREGRLTAPAPLAAAAPWPEAVTTFAPFGYRAAPGGAARLVPVTSPGLPMLMGALQIVGGHAAAFVVTPLAGAALVLLTFAIGVRVDSRRAGLLAAWITATSPPVLFMLMWPMTDVPAAACSALLVWLLLGRSPRSAVAAGVAASAGLLLRPNFVLIVGAAGLWILAEAAVASQRDRRTQEAGGLYRSRRPWMRVIGFAAATLPGVVLVAWVNTRWYGSPLASGYGAPSSLLSFERVGVNAARYVMWLLQASPLVLVGLLVIAWRVMQAVRKGGERRVTLLFAGVAVTVCSLYLVYEPYRYWWYLRFLLPAWPVASVAAAVALERMARHGRIALGIVAIGAITTGLAGVGFAIEHDVFKVGFRERRYAAVAFLVDEWTDANAVVITAEHAGSVRYYTGRETLRWDMLDEAWLDRTVAWLAAQGRHPYVLTEDWEQPAFERKFAGRNRLGRLAYAAVFAWQSRRTPGWIWLYDPLRPDAATFSPDPDLEVHRPRVAPPAARPWPRE
jgi:hypothetical protein